MKNLVDYKIMPIFPEQPLSDPQISPDGTKVLFTYTTVNIKEDRYDSHLWLLSLNEKMPKQFTYGIGNDSHPRWSPDGKTILFLSNRLDGKKNQIFVMPADGGEARILTAVEEGVQRPFWCPDGKAIFFFSTIFKGERAEGSDVKIIRRIPYKNYEGNFIHGKRTHLFSVRSGGGKVRQLTDGEFSVKSAVPSPDGSRVAFISTLGMESESSFSNIYTIPLKGGDPELLWEGKGPIGALGWSPDGEYIAFGGRVVDDPEGLRFYKNSDIWVLPIKGGEPENVTADFDRTTGMTRPYDPSGLIWSPDSKYVYFKIEDQGGEHIYRASLNKEIEPVTEGEITVGGFTLDRTGSILAFNSSDPMTPMELWIKDEEGTKRLTDMNRILLRNLRLSEPEEFWFTASDGVKVQGWIVKPHEFKEDERYPTIICIHGGPRSSYGYRLMPSTHSFQVLADHGFAVVYANYRGSTGYGEAFASAISGRRGERDYEDLMEAMDYVIETYPFVDSERLGVTGGSYGGFMTNWIIGHTDRFKAAVSMACISNQYSYHGTNDSGGTGDEISGGKEPWDSPERFLKKSPITYINNMKTPLLLIHAEQDYRCPIEQAEQLFAGLFRLKRVVEFVRFPGESHEIKGPKHIMERLQHTVRWFDRYLK